MRQHVMIDIVFRILKIVLNIKAGNQKKVSQVRNQKGYDISTEHSVTIRENMTTIFKCNTALKFGKSMYERGMSSEQLLYKYLWKNYREATLRW